MSKSTDLDPKTNSKTRTGTSAVATVERLTLFGSPQLLAGEDETAYDDFLGRIYAAEKPVDIIDEMFINDVASLEWEILRWRRLKSNLMRSCALKALKKFLSKHLDYGQYWKFLEEDLREILQETLAGQSKNEVRKLAEQYVWNEPEAVGKVERILAGTNLTKSDVDGSARARKGKALAEGYFRRKSGVIKSVNKLLARAGSGIEALMSEALVDELDDIERIDHLTTVAENRRNAMLHEIDRRRAGFGQGLRRHFQENERELEVIDGTAAEAKSAA